MAGFHEQIRKWTETADCTALLDALGYEVTPAALDGRALAAWGWNGTLEGRLTSLVAYGGLRVVRGDGVPHPQRRTLTLAVARKNPVVTTLWVWVDDDELAFAVADRRSDGTRFVRNMVVRRDQPDAVGVEQIAALAVDHVARPEIDRADALRRHFVEVLDHEGLTRAFFAEFRDHLQLLVDGIIEGPEPGRDRHEVCLVTMLRLVFLYFVQNRGLLDGDRRFLARRLRDCIARDASFHDAVMRPLFFGVLNTPAGERNSIASSLGEIPFLNGGLFEPVSAEREHLELRWPNAVWERLIDGFLERYHFTAVEPERDDESRVVDPEMLGRVFEGLMYGDDRHRSGAFYTPRDVVTRMVETTIVARLTAVTQIEDLAERADDLTLVEKESLRGALCRLTVLDPAVGTGAFLLEALNVIRRWRRSVDLDVGWSGTREILHRNLFGVDVEHTAIRLCELRLWLAMLAAVDEDAETMEPLPNLSHRVMPGNSLVEPGDVMRLADRGASFANRERAGLQAALEAKLAVLEDEFLVAHGVEKQVLRDELQRARSELQVEVLQARRELLEARLAPLDALAESPGLFGAPMASPGQRRAANDLDHQLARIEETLSDVRAERVSATFAWASSCGAAASEGFDVVLTNPPWIRATRVDPEQRRLLAARYESASGKLWPGARDLGIRTPFGTQPDVAALFLERSLELLKPGGRLCALVPAKLFHGLHGTGVRALLARHKIDALEDLSEADRAMFDATTYPAIVSVTKAAASRDDEVDVAVWRGDRRVAFRRPARELPVVRRAAGAPWILVEPEVSALFDEVLHDTVPLGVISELAPRRGIFTGANDIFVQPRGGFARLLGETALPHVRPLVTGSTLGEGSELEILWCYDDAGAPLEHVAPVVEHYFQQERGRLEQRSDHDPRLPLWQVFRARDYATTPRVVWRDIGLQIEPTVVAPDAVLLNTVYYIGCGDEVVANNVVAWMRSPIVRAFARELAERARGGWRRHFAWVIRMLPVPRAAAESGFREPACFGCDPEALTLLEQRLPGAEVA